MAMPRRATVSCTTTVQVAFFFLSQLVTVMVAVPWEMPVTTPLSLTEAIFTLLLL